MELDPSQFLAQGSSDDESDNDDDLSRAASIKNGDGPPILTSLGLTHINSVSSNPFASFLVSFHSHLNNVNDVNWVLLFFRILMIQQMMTKQVKSPVMVDVMRKFLPTVPSATCNSRIGRMLVVTRKTFTN